MRIVFAGTPPIAATVLQSLLAAGHKIIAVYTQPDRPSGRGRQLTASPVKMLAETNQLTIYQPTHLKDAAEQRIFQELKPDLMIVVAYGLILPAAVLNIPRLGCVNVHVSLLPRWRGAAPVARAILAGDTETGVSLMQMDTGLDTGPVIAVRKCAIATNDTSDSLTAKLAELGAQLLIESLTQINQWQATPQAEIDVAYAHKLNKNEALLDFTLSAAELDRKIRAFNPWPIAETVCLGETLRIFASSVLPDAASAAAGSVISATKAGLDIATGHGILRLLKVQRPGGRVLTAAEFLNAKKSLLAPGLQLGV
jgi:methionyl-tRNA formyltransferase